MDAMNVVLIIALAATLIAWFWSHLRVDGQLHEAEQTLLSKLTLISDMNEKYAKLAKVNSDLEKKHSEMFARHVEEMRLAGESLEAERQRLVQVQKLLRESTAMQMVEESKRVDAEGELISYKQRIRDLAGQLAK